MCGEQAIPDKCKRSGGGSPPRVRGTGPQGIPGKGLSRITPACAGNSCDFYRMSERQKDHPRVCGEQWFFKRGIECG